MKYTWKDDDTLVAIDKNGEELLCVKLSNIPTVAEGYVYWMDSKKSDVIRLNDNVGTAAAFSRDELLKNFEGFIGTDVSKPFNERAFWDYVMTENFVAWIDLNFFEELATDEEDKA